MRVKVVTSFFVNGKAQDPGSELDVSDHTGFDLLARGKVTRVAGEESPAAAPGPMTTDSAPELVRGREGRRR